MTQFTLVLHLKLIFYISSSIKSFFERQKQDLSDKSNKNNKRRYESNLNVSVNKDDENIFKEGIGSPRWAGILHNCLQNLKQKVDKIFELSFSTKEAQIKSAGHMEEVIKFLVNKTNSRTKKRTENFKWKGINNG